jgi:SAM-dependent methyltransferase
VTESADLIDLERSARTLLGGAACLLQAEELGVLKTLESQALTADDLAGATGVPRSLLAGMLTTLRGVGVLAHERGQWHLTPSCRAFRAGASQISNSQFGDWWSRWNLRMQGRESPAGEGEGTRGIYHLDLRRHHDRTLAAARALATAISAMDEPAQVAVVVDIGCGSGAFGRELARASGGHAVGIDLPDVARAAAALGGSGLRIVASDFRRMPLRARSVDVVILANVVHLLDARAAEELVSAACLLLRPGGVAVLVEPVLDLWEDDTESGVYCCDLFARTGGHCYSDSELRTCIGAAGLSVSRCRRLPSDMEPLWAYICARRA